MAADVRRLISEWKIAGASLPRLLQEELSRLYFRDFVAHFGRSMRRQFLELLIAAAAISFAAQVPARADADLIKSAVLEGNVAYFRAGNVGKNLPGEIQSAQNALASTNKIAGTILDLRFANGDDLDSATAAAYLFGSNKLPVAVLVNGETRGAAAKLAEDLRGKRAGLVFGSSTEVRPDIAVAVAIEDEKKYLENPYGTTSSDGTNSLGPTNTLLPFVDHTSEADLVRERLRSGGTEESPQTGHAAEPPKPFIHDPVLARGVDFIKGLAILRPMKN